jgi:hypothetical protein
MRLSRSSGTDACATALAGIAESRMTSARSHVAPDDVSVVVLDLMPNILTDFLGVVGVTKPAPAVVEDGARAGKCATSLARVIARLGKKLPAQKPAPVSAWPDPVKPVPAVILADVDCADEAQPATCHVSVDEREAFRCDSAYTGDAEDSAALRKTLKDGLVARQPVQGVTAPSPVRVDNAHPGGSASLRRTLEDGVTTPEPVKGVRAPPRIRVGKAEPALIQQYMSGSLPFPVV